MGEQNISVKIACGLFQEQTTLTCLDEVMGYVSFFLIHRHAFQANLVIKKDQNHPCNEILICDKARQPQEGWVEHLRSKISAWLVSNEPVGLNLSYWEGDFD